MRLSIVLLTSALLVPAVGRAQISPHAEAVDWWPLIETIDSILADGKWKAAAKQAERASRRVVAEAWNDRDLDRVLAELALRRALAGIHLGRVTEANWNWYLATNLDPRIAERDLSTYEKGDALPGSPPRKREYLPDGYDRLTDLEMVRLEPPTFPEVRPPDILSNSVASMQRLPDVTIEAILDRFGRLHLPVVWSDDAHPILIHAAFQWLEEMPPAEPAKLDGRPVDSLQLLTVTFSLERDAPVDIGP